MPATLPAALRPTLTAFLLLAGLMVAGCSSENAPRRGPGGRQGHEAMPTLQGHESFFADRILAEVQIGAMAGIDRTGEGDKPGSDGSPRQGRRHHGGGGYGNGMGGGGRERDGGERPAPVMRGLDGSGSPPVVIHLRFSNRGTNPVDVEIVDFVSPLGNFAVQPSHLQLAAGQSAEVEPMGSRLANDATSGQISLSLRLEGVKETKTVTVQVEPVPPAPTKS